MYKYENKIFQQLPSFIPRMVRSYSSDKIVILKSKNIFSEPKGFDSYKFHIVNTQMPSINIEGKKYVEKPGCVFPINPNQIHSYKDQGEVNPYLAFFVDKEYIKETSNLMYNKSNISFKTDNFPVNQNFNRLINTFIEETTNHQVGYEFILQALNIQIVTFLLRHTEHNRKKETSSRKYKDKHLIKTVEDYFMEHYCDEFSLDDLAKIANYSPYHFIKVFKDNTGKTPFEYLLDIKINKAKEMLKKNNDTITEVCFLCGFKNRTHFSNVFKKKIGVSPSHYRKMTQT